MRAKVKRMSKRRRKIYFKRRFKRRLNRKYGPISPRDLGKIMLDEFNSCVGAGWLKLTDEFKAGLTVTKENRNAD